MKKSKKSYIKSFEKYSNGYIEDALKLCEESIALNVNNSSAINLKGLLFYLRGNLKNAQSLWKMNLDINKDEISKKYLEDSKEDIKRLKIYHQSLKLLKVLKVKEAINLLIKCLESDFNSINVNNKLAICYMKKAQYDKAKQHIDKVLSIDRKNEIALKNKDILIKIGIINKKKNRKKVAISILIIGSIILVGEIATRHINIYKYNKKKGSNIISENEVKKLEEVNVEQNINIKDKKELIDKIKIHIDKKQFDFLFNDLKHAKEIQLDDNEKVFIYKAEKLMKNEGLDYFYNRSSEFIKKKDFKNAILFLSKAYEYSKDTWYYPHVVYMNGVCNEREGNIRESINYYSIYDKNIEEGNYGDVVLYNLALLYKNIDIDKSKVYAKKLINKFPKSMYNNSKITDILKL